MPTAVLVPVASDIAAPAERDVPVAELSDLINHHIATRRYSLGMVLPTSVVAADLGVPAARLRSAFADLTKDGTLALNGRRIAVPYPPDARLRAARRLAGRILTQVTAGLYPPCEVLPGVAELARHCISEPPLMRMALKLLEDDGWIGRTPARSRVVLPSGLLLAPAARTALPPRPDGGTGMTECRIRNVVRLAKNRWISRRFLPPEAVEQAWLEMRATAAQILPPPGRQRPRPMRREAHATARVREAATAPLPDTALLGLWHTACLAIAIRDLLFYVGRRTT
ncbi:hypothetical protein ACIQWN_37935 [Streptomyces vinaceus]|uniref:hypothetical protein n=1 Tax=Streptomyces vinaceus TaxID=1960 RepID=UPI00381C0F57